MLLEFWEMKERGFFFFYVLMFLRCCQGVFLCTRTGVLPFSANKTFIPF